MDDDGSLFAMRSIHVVALVLTFAARAYAVDGIEGKISTCPGRAVNRSSGC
jgi:hypothetical protein